MNGVNETMTRAGNVMEHTEIEGCTTIPALFRKRVQERTDKVALREKDFGIWNEYTWGDWGEQARLVGNGLLALGLKRGDVCSVAAEVVKEWQFADLGIICAGGVTNGVYPTDSAAQVEYLINDSGTRFYFAEDEEQLDKVLAVRDNTPTLAKIILFDMEGLRQLDDPMCLSFEELLTLGRDYAEANPRAWDAAIDKAQPDDLMILTYTSGTTGPPKGSMIGHANMMFMMMTLQRSYGVFETDEQLGFLPLAHVAGRMFYTFLVIQAASVVNLVENPETLARDIQEVSPSVHFAVPRVWEKQFSAVQIKLKEATPLGRFAYATAIRLGERRASYQKSGAAVPAPLRLAAFCADALVLKNVRRLLGIDACRWLATAAAPIAPELIEWFWALGKPMYECYGQTECAGIATANVQGAFRIGSVGKATEGVEVMLAEQDEIIIRKPRRDPRLLEQGRANGRDLHPRLAAYRRRGSHRRRRLCLCGRSHEGHHHHRRRQEHHAKRNREPAEVLALHHGRRGGGRPSPLPDLPRDDRRRERHQVRPRQRRAVHQLYEPVPHSRSGGSGGR